MLEKNVLIIGNWKMNKTASETKAFFQDFAKLYHKHEAKISPLTKFGFAIPAVNLRVAKEHQKDDRIIIVAQNVYFEKQGAYTGEISTSMLKELGVNAVIIGHSERRQHFNETNEMVNKKLHAVLSAHLTPIVCVGETLKQRKSGQWKDFVSDQIKSLYSGIKSDDYSKVVIAYEPIWAIGTGVTATTKEAQEACHFIRNVIAKLSSKTIAKQVIIQYGGSVKPENIFDLITQKDINGALVGGASLDPKTFLKLLTMNK